MAFRVGVLVVMLVLCQRLTEGKNIATGTQNLDVKLCSNGIPVPCGANTCYQNVPYPCGVKTCDGPFGIPYPCGVKMCDQSVPYPCGVKLCSQNVPVPCEVKASGNQEWDEALKEWNRLPQPQP